MINKKAIAGILIVAIALASVAIAVSAQGEGGVQPRMIVPGGIQHYHLADTAVEGDKVVNKTILNGDIGDDEINTTLIANHTILKGDIGASEVNTTHIINGTVLLGDLGDMQSIVDSSTAAFDLTTDTGESAVEAFNESISIPPGAKARLLIIYSANCSGVPPESTVKARAYVKAGATNYSATPAMDVNIAGSGFYGMMSTVTFYNVSVGSEAEYVHVNAWTTTAPANLTGQVLTIIPIPTSA